MSFEVHIPKTMLIGKGARRETSKVSNDLGITKALLVSDNFLLSSGVVDEFKQILESGGLRVSVFTDIDKEPEIKNVLGCLKMLKENDCDGIISFGGGSSIDTAKAASILATNPGEISDYMGIGKVKKAGLPHIAIPTTAGTGSEVTRVTIITNEQTNVKMMCLSNELMPSAAIVDYELTMTMPKALTSFVGIDALTHAIEAYVSKKANTVSDIFAVRAIKLISENILIAYNEPTNEKARSAMMEGATYAGIAFSNASVCAVHGMSRPIGANFHVPHGLSNAMLLPVVTKHSLKGSKKRYAIIAKLMNLEGETLDELSNNLFEHLKNLNFALNIPNLKQNSVDEEKFLFNLEGMAEAAIQSGSPANNPVIFTKEEIINIYKEAYDFK